MQYHSKHLIRQGNHKVKKNGTGFYLFWSTQMVSTLGSSMTSYALILWIYERTHRAFPVSLLSFYSYISYIIASFLTGPFIDRGNRKRTLVLCDSIAALCSLLICIVSLQHNLNTGYVFAAAVIVGATNAVSAPIQTIVAGCLIPQRNYEKASGLKSFSSSLTAACTPAFATVFYSIWGLSGILIVDLCSFFVAVSALLFVINVPEPAPTERKDQGSYIEEGKIGYLFLLQHKGLFQIIISMCIMNFFSRLTYENILPAMILGRSGSSTVLAWVTGVIGIGGIVGGLMVSLFPLPKHKVKLLYVAAGFSFLFGDLLMGFGKSLWLWLPAAVAASIPIPFIIATQQYLLYQTVPEQLQGKVFAARNAIQYATIPIGILLGGWLSDSVFEPLIGMQGSIPSLLRKFLGSTPGSGMGAMFLCTGILGTLTCIIAARNKHVKKLDSSM
ncbi:MAG: MFS transporter [Spirochaetia bacterium]|jgi:predicted MFS family arabinose efflux permease|nr:MFS transporter [Spirochaetia bacterium]